MSKGFIIIKGSKDGPRQDTSNICQWNTKFYMEVVKLNKFPKLPSGPKPEKPKKKNAVKKSAAKKSAAKKVTVNLKTKNVYPGSTGKAAMTVQGFSRRRAA